MDQQTDVQQDRQMNGQPDGQNAPQADRQMQGQAQPEQGPKKATLEEALALNALSEAQQNEVRTKATLKGFGKLDCEDIAAETQREPKGG